MQGKQRSSGVCEAAYQGRVCFYENDVVSLRVFVNKPKTMKMSYCEAEGGTASVAWREEMGEE